MANKRRIPNLQQLLFGRIDRAVDAIRDPAADHDRSSPGRLPITVKLQNGAHLRGSTI